MKANCNPIDFLTIIIVLYEISRNLNQLTKKITFKLRTIAEDESKIENVQSFSENQQEKETELTLLSDNFVRFEVSFYNIMAFMLNVQNNPFKELLLLNLLDTLNAFCCSSKA